VSVAWLNRIADALGVTAVDLVTLPDRPVLPVAATLDATGAHAPRQPATAASPLPEPGAIAIRVVAATGDYRAGDAIWCRPLAPAAFAQALHRDVLAPGIAGRFAFGRLLAAGQEGVTLLPPASGARPVDLAAPPWIAVATRLVRALD
jgi:hypothetical protein